MKRLIRKDRKGFSLMEVMIVLGIIALIAGMVGPSLFKQFQRAKEKAVKTQIKKIYSVLEEYAEENDGQYPGSLDELVPKYFKKSELKDPLCKDGFVYSVSGDKAELYSKGNKCKGGENEVRLKEDELND